MSMSAKIHSADCDVPSHVGNYAPNPGFYNPTIYGVHETTGTFTPNYVMGEGIISAQLNT